MGRVWGLGLLVGVLVLSGCSSPPPRDKVVEQFKAELAAGMDLSEGVDATGFAEHLADDALDGDCASDMYVRAMVNAEIDDGVMYAWAAVCLEYFEDEMSAAQITQANDYVIKEAVSDSD